MGVYIKTGDDARYYQPSLVTDSATDRADEIAVGSDGGGRGYIASSGVQDAPMTLTVANKNLMEVTRGFTFLLGSFSNVWAGSGGVRLRLSDADDRVFFREFLSDKALSNYTYSVSIAVVDRAGHISAKELTLDSSVYVPALAKFKSTFSLPAKELTFGSDTIGTPFTDLSKVSVYLRGYFYEEGKDNAEYVGGVLEVGGSGATFPFYLRGFASKRWNIIASSVVSIDITTGVFKTGPEIMPLSEKITATVAQYSSSVTLLRAAIFPVYNLEQAHPTDFVTVSQWSSVPADMKFSMRTIRHKSSSARSFRFEIFNPNGHGWQINCPAFITPSSTSGSGSGTITLAFSNNNTGDARGGIIFITDTTTDQIYQIPCVQLGVERFYAVEDITSGQAKTVRAYAANIVKKTFDMEVLYYNAASFNLYLRQIGFNIADFASKENGLATLNMKSGACAGRDFNITACEYDGTHDRWRLTLDRLEDSSVGMVYPNISFPIREGDRFVLTDILMPEVYILVAERRLLAKARVYYDRNSKLRYLYDLEIDSKWVRNEGVYLRPGMYMQIADADLIGANPAYVLIDTVTVTYGDSNIPVYKVTLREKLYLPE